MDVWLYYNKSDERYLNKNLQQISLVHNVYFKDENNVIDPILIFDDIPPSVNYCFISELDRYYYLRDVKFIEGQFITEWHVDVLMTYKDEIKKQVVVADRCSDQWKQYIDDNILKIEQYKGEYIRNFDNQPFSLETVSFVLGVLGSG